MVLDGHIHVWSSGVDQEKLLERMHQGGVEGGNILSQAPASFDGALKAGSPESRLTNLMAWCADAPSLRPFFLD